MILKAFNRFPITYQPMIKFPNRHSPAAYSQIQFSGKTIKMTPRDGLNQAMD